MKKISCAALFLFINLFIYLHAQHAIGSWQSYLSYHNATLVEPAGNLIYAVGNGGLYSYDKEDESVQCYWKNQPLSDTEITNIGYQKSNKTLVIIYSNYNIDLLVNDEDVYNLPDYKEKNMTQDKTVNSIMFEGDNAYLATSFGIIVINLKRKEISNTYFLNRVVNSTTIMDNQIYAATNDGLFTALLTDNLLDVNNWKKVSDTVYQSLSVFKNELIGKSYGWGILLINKENYSNQLLIAGNYNYMNAFDDRLIAGTSGALVIFNDINNNHYMEPGLGINNIGYENGVYWAARGDNGLSGFKISDTDKSITMNVSSIIPNSPKRNYNFYMTLAGDKLLIAGGQTSSRNVRKGTIMVLESNNWTSFEEDGIAESTNLPYQNITDIIQDPRDEKRHFATSFGQGLYEFYDGKFVNLYSLDNSTLESALPNESSRYQYVRVNGQSYDNNNNLWMVCASPNNPIQVLKADNTWHSMDYSSLNNPTIFKSTLFDKRGNFWAISSYPSDYGIFCLNYNGTIENTSDDQHKFVKDFKNQDGTTLNHKGINCFVEDQNGAIWVGTNQGPIVLNNTTRFFNNDYYCTQIKVPRNDGTSLADFLLDGQQINAIAIDGGNRKWIGTETNGIYLLSPDGLETIQHFTEENSPLPSNSISSIAIHPKNGKIFIGTMKGLVSYQSEVTAGETSFDDDNVYAYPNPVHPNYSGLITVTGLMTDSDIKITNVSGKLIYEGSSIGGQFTWNGRNMQGNRVASGVYFVIAANKEGKEGIITKIMFIR